LKNARQHSFHTKPEMLHIFQDFVVRTTACSSIFNHYSIRKNREQTESAR